MDDFNKDRYVLLATKSGLIKRIKLSSLYVTRYSKALKATKITDDDCVVSCDVCNGSDYEIVIATKDGFMKFLQINKKKSLYFLRVSLDFLTLFCYDYTVILCNLIDKRGIQYGNENAQLRRTPR